MRVLYCPSTTELIGLIVININIFFSLMLVIFVLRPPAFLWLPEMQQAVFAAFLFMAVAASKNFCIIRYVSLFNFLARLLYILCPNSYVML
jgi:hypothetical protein